MVTRGGWLVTANDRPYKPMITLIACISYHLNTISHYHYLLLLWSSAISNRFMTDFLIILDATLFCLMLDLSVVHRFCSPLPSSILKEVVISVMPASVKMLHGNS